MPATPSPTSLGPERVDELVALIGLSDRPSATAAGLAATYSAWCRAVPFDNLQKLLALPDPNAELPGMNPHDFFATWQEHGTGGTCWSSNGALHALLTALGFEADMWSASMFDGPVNHATTVGTVDGRRWLVDTAVHGDTPVEMVDGSERTVDFCGMPTTLRADEGGWMLDFPTPDPGFLIPCRIIEPIDHATAIEGNEKSRAWSPFNSGIMAGINDATGVWMLSDAKATRIDASGRTTTNLTPQEEDGFLVEVVGCSADVVGRVRDTLGRS